MVRPVMNSAMTGVSLLEVLISLVIMSIGLLGIASLQIQSKRASFEAIQRTTATMLTHEVVERMRNNTSTLSDYLVTVGGGTITSEPSPNCRDANTCTPQQLALHDLWEWEQALDGAAETSGSANTGGLVSPTACITGPAGGGSGFYTVAIAWRGQTSLSDPTGNTCGQGSGKYDSDAASDDAHRRLLVINVFVEAD